MRQARWLLGQPPPPPLKKVGIVIRYVLCTYNVSITNMNYCDYQRMCPMYASYKQYILISFILPKLVILLNVPITISALQYLPSRGKSQKHSKHISNIRPQLLTSILFIEQPEIYNNITKSQNNILHNSSLYLVHVQTLCHCSSTLHLKTHNQVRGRVVCPGWPRIKCGIECRHCTQRPNWTIWL